MALADLQQRLAEVLPQRDPVGALRRICDKALSPAELQTLQQLTEDGLLLTSLVVVKLRMQQLLRSPEAAELFEDDPEAFAKMFEQYHTDCPPADFFPEGEVARFAAWRNSRCGSG